MKKDRVKWKEKEWRRGAAALGAALLLAGAALWLGGSPLSSVQLVTEADVLLLDPGHGGMDGGAEGASGVCEKDINLSIALAVRELAEADGWTVVMTRETDMDLYQEEEKCSIRSRKTKDLIARKEMIDQVAPLLAVSIHLNSFRQDASVRGAQTFYAIEGDDSQVLEESKRLAESIQEQLIEGLQDGTERTPLGKGDARILEDPVSPTVIVECGFLSNREEETLLQTEDYQKKLAACIYEGVLMFTGREARQSMEIIESKGE
ncbi:MAG: N-acetylmuramoyl-L-alanine amidase [Bacillota bacterium]|nr:N-acetylmuramoyl-L-alanine amidase [Bacillota bacterium]